MCECRWRGSIRWLVIYLILVNNVVLIMRKINCCHARQLEHVIHLQRFPSPRSIFSLISCCRATRGFTSVLVPVLDLMHNALFVLHRRWTSRLHLKKPQRLSSPSRLTVGVTRGEGACREAARTEEGILLHLNLRLAGCVSASWTAASSSRAPSYF